MNGPPPLPREELVARFRRDLEALTGEGAAAPLGIAVSGGPDSVAMLILAHAALPGQVRGATVDHGLRPEAGAEADFVAALCARLDIPHETFHPDEPITGNIQSAARAARYKLLEQWRERHDLAWIATAHHGDDQAETLLMRLNRGSGVGGLAGIRAVNGRIVRPLLGWRRAELEAIVQETGIEPVCDSSNYDERFDRARLRRHLLDADWVDPVALARSAAALEEADQALEWVTDRLVVDRVDNLGSVLKLDPARLPPELRRRLLRRVLARLAPDSAPRGEEIGRLLHALEQGAASTLAGVKATGGAIWHFEPEPPRRS